MLPPPALDRRSAATVVQARRGLWLVVWVVVVDVAVGGGWDAEWHTTQPFDGFFSPPHLFIYTLAALAMALVARLLVRPDLRVWFGPPARPPGLPARFAVPPALLLLAGGMAGIALAGPLDAMWHTAYGLDETPWSVPHSMLGVSLLVLALGALACRIALAEHTPMRPWTLPLLALLVLFGTLTLLGPFANASPDAVRIAGAQGALASDLDAQHLVRVYLRWNLTRTHPAFVVVGAAWAGFAIALLCSLVHRALVWFPLLAVFAVLLDAGAADNAERLGLADDPATRSGVPVLWAAVPVLLARRRGYPLRAFAAAGAVFGLVSYAVWTVHADPVVGFVMVLVAPVAAVAGARAGRWAAEVVRTPSAASVGTLAGVLVLGWPAVTGTIDLVLRATTP